MAKRKKLSVEQSIIEGLKAAAMSEHRLRAESDRKAQLNEQERQEQIRQFKKNIRGAKVFVWK
jgi:hypothetical protein